MSLDEPDITLDNTLLQELMQARLGDPFLLLGPRWQGKTASLRVWLPAAETVQIAGGPALKRVEGSDLFVWSGAASELPKLYRLAWVDRWSQPHEGHDPYAFDQPLIPDFDLHLFGEGKHWHAQRILGAHALTLDGVTGVRFSCWAPHAARVSIVGDFNRWNGISHPMRGHASGVWQLFVPDLAPGALYKFEIRNQASGDIFVKSDPYGRRFELRPLTSSLVAEPSTFDWADDDWLARRAKLDWSSAPMSIYEMHLGSWQLAADGGFLNYRELAHRLVPYLSDLNFTHVELLPVTEHPFDGSWGYQTVGTYAPTSRHGTPDDFRYFVDYCHRHGLGVLMDWVPAHFPKDPHGLARFDGAPLYEYPDPQRGEHPEWGTLIYDYGRPQVRNFLVSNALYWIEEFHVDGLRVDAVASMLYLSYARNHGQWAPNRYGGPEHLEAVDFIRDLNTVVHGEAPGAVVIAEESTSWPQVTRPTNTGGLGFSMKWDMGWMHDTIDYFKLDPVHRRHHHNELTFGLMYAFSENYVLALSHDEVVHGKSPMIYKMPGDDWQKFANLRLLYGWMYTRPGKKLLFMGCEFAQTREWSHERELDWWLDTQPLHAGMRRWLSDLNALHRDVPAFHEIDFSWNGFEWIDANDASQSIYIYLRRDKAGREWVTVINATPVPRQGYRIGLPHAGQWREALNSDAAIYGGSNVGNLGELQAEEQGWMGRPASVLLTLPPLGALVLESLTGRVL